MDFDSGCTICGKELEYQQEYRSLTCYYCGSGIENNVSCPEGHFVCDSCHSGNAIDLIENFCNTSESIDPVAIANFLMRNPVIKMHGPEHHYLVPAVLLCAYYNHTNTKHKKRAFLKVARRRAESVLGGFCGTHGNCGAAVGCGIFISIVTGNTPLAEKEWQLSNTVTGKALLAIAHQGGPRCCKRDSYTAITVAIDFLEEHFNLSLPKNPITCSFSKKNKQCKLHECQHYQEDLP